MTIGNRIKQKREERRMTLDEVAKKVGITRQTIQKYESGVISNIPSDRIELLAAALDVSPGYLMGWTNEYGDKPTAHHATTTSNVLPSPDPKGGSTAWGEPLLDAYAAFAPHAQKIVCKVLDIHHVVPGKGMEKDAKGAEPFPLSEQDVAAGTGIYLGPDEFRVIMVRKGCLPRNASFGVTASGDSMEPRFHDGDILIVSKDKAEDGQIGIFTMDGMGYAKLRKGRFLHSLNPNYADIPMEEDTICNGAVIGVLDKDCIVEE